MALLNGRPNDVELVALLAAGGLGLGVQFATVIGHLANAVPARNAPDISGASTTTLQIGGALGVAGFGTLYLALTTQPGAPAANHGFALTCLALSAAALTATFNAYLTTHVPAPTDPDPAV
ncbi:MAG: hypothetical protein M3Z25_00135 [Actinomycetota bacterium]|nr:hypothetical protein [Actinomycetota bacterium]